MSFFRNSFFRRRSSVAERGLRFEEGDDDADNDTCGDKMQFDVMFNVVLVPISTCAPGDEVADELMLPPAPPAMPLERCPPRTMLSHTATNGGRFGDVRLLEEVFKSEI